MRSILMLAAAAAAFFSMTSSSRAQNGVPGGWSNQVNYQGVGQGFGVIGQPYGGYGGSFGSSYGGYNPGVVRGSYRANPNYVLYPQTTNNLGVLGATIHRTTRVRRIR